MTHNPTNPNHKSWVGLDFVQFQLGWFLGRSKIRVNSKLFVFTKLYI